MKIHEFHLLVLCMLCFCRTDDSMFTVRRAANVLSQVTIICFSKLKFKESAF